MLGFGSHIWLVLPSIVVGFTIHEFCHAYASYKLGDYRAKEDGRITLNPIKHVDAFGLLLLLIIGFGWAKPVMVSPNYYKKPAAGMALVAIAGPASNFILALIGIVLNLIFKEGIVGLFLIYFWMINLGMCVFNLLPIPPLDGSKIFGFLVSGEDYMDFLQYERYGFIALIILFYMNAFTYIFSPIFSFVHNFIYGFNL